MASWTDQLDVVDVKWTTFIIIPAFNTIPDDKILALYKLNAYAHDNFIMVKMLQFLFDMIENIVGKN